MKSAFSIPGQKLDPPVRYPRAVLQVYSWFLASYRISLAVGATGYILLLVEMLGLGHLLVSELMTRHGAVVLDTGCDTLFWPNCQC